MLQLSFSYVFQLEIAPGEGYTTDVRTRSTKGLAYHRLGNAHLKKVISKKL